MSSVRIQPSGELEPRLVASDSPERHIAFLSTYPPKRCGLATFTKNLSSSLAEVGHSIEVLAITNGGEDNDHGCEVSFLMERDNPRAYVEAARYLNESDVDLVILEHEFGIFGGPSGNMVLKLVDNLDKPLVTTLHTVLPDPPDLIKGIVGALTSRSERLVAMSRSAVKLLEHHYGIPRERLVLIPHGCPDISLIDEESSKDQIGLAGRTVVSTFGLLGPGKGLEYAIRALPKLIADRPEVTYLIIGATHPNEKKANGEQYREGLKAIVRDLQLERNVNFVDRYLTERELIRFLSATDIYVTPYLNGGQVVSGTLTYALGAGKAIVSTPFLYALELLAEGRGLLCHFRDSTSLSEALRRLAADGELRRCLSMRAYKYGRNLTWSRVASAYADLVSEISPRHDRLLPPMKEAPQLAFGGRALRSLESETEVN